MLENCRHFSLSLREKKLNNDIFTNKIVRKLILEYYKFSSLISKLIFLRKVFISFPSHYCYRTLT